MGNTSNDILEMLNVVPEQRPEWDQRGKKAQVVTAYFTTPSDFSGQVDMSLSDWADPETRNAKIMEAAMALDWRLKEAIEGSAKKGK